MDSFSKFMGEIAAKPKPAAMAPSVKTPPVIWKVSKGLTGYEQAVARMETIVAAIQAEQEPEQVWLVEHPPLYTAGTSAKAEDLLAPDRFPVFKTGRGGEFTYHGPGQRVAYVMLDLRRRTPDVRAFVSALEQWVITTLADFDVHAGRRPGRIGVWVERPDKPRLPDGSPHDDKIAAIGIRLRRWVSFHGVAINVKPDLSHFSGIVPCGISGHGVTSLADLGLSVEMADLDAALKRNFTKLFGQVE